jgi:hypothetical protein
VNPLSFRMVVRTLWGVHAGRTRPGAVQQLLALNRQKDDRLVRLG